MLQQIENARKATMLIKKEKKNELQEGKQRIKNLV
jgi:hypothetical protein